MTRSFSSQTLGIFATIAPEYFTHTGLETLFMTHGIQESEENKRASKQKRVLNAINLIRDSDERGAADKLRRMIDALVPRFNESDYGRSGESPGVTALIESLEKDGWVIDAGRLVSTDGQTFDAEEVVLPERSLVRSETRTSRRIFVVHGRDKVLRQQVESFIRKIRYEPCLLGDEANSGRTVIEKLLDEAQDVAYAIVLLTPDDEGRLAGSDDPAALRPRQNVLFEWGCLVGMLGRSSVAALVRKGVEIPSDLSGVAYINAKEEPEVWQMRLIREMQKANLKVDTDLL